MSFSKFSFNLILFRDFNYENIEIDSGISYQIEFRKITWDINNSDFEDYKKLYNKILDLQLPVEILQNTELSISDDWSRLSKEQSLLPFIYHLDTPEDWIFTQKIHKLRIKNSEKIKSRLLLD